MQETLKKAYEALTEPEDTAESVDRNDNTANKTNISLNESQENTG